MGLQHLSQVHAGRYTDWVQYQVDRGTVREERHVLFGQDSSDHALVAVTAGHLVTLGDLPSLRYP